MRKYLLLTLFAGSTMCYAQSASEIINSMFEHANVIKGFTAEINKVERFENEFVVQVSEVKVRRNPYQVYIRQLAPKEGIEVLVSSTDKKKKAVVNLNSFPWINLYLDPYGILMRRNQHHLVFDSGFDLMIKILKSELKNETSYSNLKRKADSYWQGRDMYQLELINNDYGLVIYTVQKNETVDDIADKLNVNAYAILELNDSVDDYEDIDPGQKIRVPNHYAKSMNLLIDKKTFLPLVIKVFDIDGLYEKYEYNSIKLNPVFEPNEFTENFEKYNF